MKPLSLRMHGVLWMLVGHEVEAAASWLVGVWAG